MWSPELAKSILLRGGAEGEAALVALEFLNFPPINGYSTEVREVNETQPVCRGSFLRHNSYRWYCLIFGTCVSMAPSDAAHLERVSQNWRLTDLLCSCGSTTTRLRKLLHGPRLSSDINISCEKSARNSYSSATTGVYYGGKQTRLTFTFLSNRNWRFRSSCRSSR